MVRPGSPALKASRRTRERELKMRHSAIATSSLIIATFACAQANAQTATTWMGYPAYGSVVAGTPADGPGAAAYGAQDQADRTAIVYIDGLFPFEPPIAVEIDPWRRIDGFNGDRPIHYPGVGHVSEGADGTYPNAFTRGLDKIADRLETARKQWLKDNGYVGGVRAFHNRAASQASVDRRTLPEPRGIIVVPDEIKRQRTRFQVRADETEPAAVVSFRRMSPDTRISMPLSVRIRTIRVADAEPEGDRVAGATEATADNDS